MTPDLKRLLLMLDIDGMRSRRYLADKGFAMDLMYHAEELGFIKTLEEAGSFSSIIITQDGLDALEKELWRKNKRKHI